MRTKRFYKEPLSYATFSSALLTGVVQACRAQPAALLAGAAALNSGISAATFFALREYIVGPSLVTCMPTEQYTRRRQQISNHEAPLANMTRSQRRKHKLLDSALAGALTAFSLVAWKTKTVSVRGPIVASLFCTIAQAGYNEVSLRRQPRDLAFSDTLPVLVDNEETKFGWGERFVRALGVRQLSEEEYLRRLKASREVYLRRIAELEGQAEQEAGLESTPNDTSSQ